MAETIHCGNMNAHGGHPNGTGHDGKPGWCPGSQGGGRD